MSSIARTCAGSIIVALMLLLSIVAFAADNPSTSNRWRIDIAERAASDGMLKLRLTPKTGAAVDIQVPITNGREIDGIARDIRTALRGKLDRTAYGIEIQNRQALILTAELGTPRFELSLLESSVKATKITISKF